MIDVSVVLPTYNERENIILLLPQIKSILEKNSFKNEIIIVDDSSLDGTDAAAEELNKKYGNIKVIIRAKKEGIGAALREGYDAAKGKLIFSMDSDLSFDINIMPVILKRLNEDYDLVVGNRHTLKDDYEAKTLNVITKRFISKFGNKFLRLITKIEIHDFTANFRGIKKEVWQNIKTKEKTNAFLFETILLTNYYGFKIGEERVLFKDRLYGKSKLNSVKEVPKFLLKAVYLSLKNKLRLI